MKRMIVSMLLIFLLLGLCACGVSEGRPETKAVHNEEQTVQMELAPEETDTFPEIVIGREKGKIALTVDEFKQVAGTYINVAEYEVEEYKSDPYAVSYDLNYEIEKTQSYGLDYTVLLEDGSTITLPATYQQIVSAGWTTEADVETAMSNSVNWRVEFTNGNGNCVEIRMTAPTEEATPIKDCIAYGIQIVSFDERYGGVNKQMPRYVVCGGISEESGMKEVIEYLGSPSNIEFDAAATYYGPDNNAVIKLTYNEKMTNWYSSLIFVISAETDEILQMQYEYSTADIS